MRWGEIRESSDGIRARAVHRANAHAVDHPALVLLVTVLGADYRHSSSHSAQREYDSSSEVSDNA